MHFVFVISTVGQRLEELRRLLLCVEREAPDALVLVADQSTGTAVDEVTRPFEFVRRLPSSGGLSRGRNDCLDAVPLAAPAIVLFPNDNTLYPPGVLRDIASRMDERHLDVLAGRLVYTNGGIPFPVPATCTRLERQNAALAMSATLAIRSDCFVGGLRFDEGLGTGSRGPYQAGEETDLLLRLLENGASAELHPDVVISGEDATGSMPLRLRLRKTWGYSRAHTHVLVNHHFPPAEIARALVRPLVRAALSLVRMDVSGALVAFTRFLGRCRGLAP